MRVYEKGRKSEREREVERREEEKGGGGREAINPKKIVDAKNREKRNRECLKGEKKTPKEKEDLEEWNAVDEHSKLIEAVR